MGAHTKDPVGAEDLTFLDEQELEDRDYVLQLCDVVAKEAIQWQEPLEPRAGHGPELSDEPADKAEVMSHHAEQAARLQQGLVAAINRLSLGVCILDQAGAVIDMNQEFERQVHDYDAFRLGPDGKLDFTAARGQVCLIDLMARAGKHHLHKEVMPVASGTRARALCVDIEVLQPSEDGCDAGSTGAIIYSMDTGLRTEVSVDPLAQTYDLTPTEATLTKMVCEGLTNGQIAKKRGRAVETINAQVKSVLAKTGCANRTQLVRIMTRFGTDFLVR